MARIATMLSVVLLCFTVSLYSQETLTNDSVVKLVKAGLGEDLIANMVNSQPGKYSLGAEDIIALKNQGVSEKIITVMVKKTDSGSSSAPSPDNKDGTEVSIPDGTEVKLRLAKPMSSATAQLEDRVEFEAAEDVVVNGLVVVKKGASGAGKVTEAQGKKSFGRRGKLNFTIDAVKAVDGQNIRLRSTRETKGSDSYGKAGVVTLLVGPFGALVKGKDVEIPAGTEYSIYIDGDRKVTLNSAVAP